MLFSIVCVQCFKTYDIMTIYRKNMKFKKDVYNI